MKKGDDVILDCRLVAVPEAEICWYFLDKKITTKDNITIVTESDMHMYCSVMKITKVTKEQEGKYTIIAKNREGEAIIEIPLKVNNMLIILLNFYLILVLKSSQNKTHIFLKK